MELQVDEHVEKVIAFMQTNLPAAKLVAVANAIKELATPLWGHYEREEIVPLSLRHGLISADDQHTQSISSE